MKSELPVQLSLERAKLSRGERISEPDENGTVFRYPSAARMEEMKWSTVAFEIAKKQSLKEDSDSSFKFPSGPITKNGRKYYLVVHVSYDATCEEGWRELVRATNTVVFPIRPIKQQQVEQVTDIVFPSKQNKIRSEMLKSWAEATEVGCYQKDDVFYGPITICAIGSITNFENGTVYEEGEPCSKCSKGTFCDEKMLCLTATDRSTTHKPRISQNTTVELTTTEKLRTQERTTNSLNPITRQAPTASSNPTNSQITVTTTHSVPVTSPTDPNPLEEGRISQPARDSQRLSQKPSSSPPPNQFYIYFCIISTLLRNIEQ